MYVGWGCFVEVEDEGHEEDWHWFEDVAKDFVVEDEAGVVVDWDCYEDEEEKNVLLSC